MSNPEESQGPTGSWNEALDFLGDSGFGDLLLGLVACGILGLVAWALHHHPAITVEVVAAVSLVFAALLYWRISQRITLSMWRKLSIIGTLYAGVVALTAFFAFLFCSCS